jgi:hypothetical protein
MIAWDNLPPEEIRIILRDLPALAAFIVNISLRPYTPSVWLND